MVELLLDRRVCTDAMVDHDGEDLMVWRVIMGHVGTVKLLLSHAAPAVPIAVPTLIKATLRSTAIEDENVRAEIVEMLRDAGHGVEHAT